MSTHHSSLMVSWVSISSISNKWNTFPFYSQPLLPLFPSLFPERRLKTLSLTKMNLPSSGFGASLILWVIQKEGPLSVSIWKKQTFLFLYILLLSLIYEVSFWAHYHSPTFTTPVFLCGKRVQGRGCLIFFCVVFCGLNRHFPRKTITAMNGTILSQLCMNAI